MTKIKLPLKQAQALTDKIIAALSPGCVRLEAAGSVRRLRAEVGDLEIVAIARPELDSIIEQLLADNRLAKGDKNGKKLKNFLVPSVPGLGLDLFLPTVDTWGAIFTIRTGCAEFSHKLVTQQNKGGFLPSDLHVKEGRIWRGSEALRTPNEADVFKLLGWYIPPEQRTADFRPSRNRLVLMNRIGQGHLEPGMNLERMKGILRDADLANLDSASDEELGGIWRIVEAATKVKGGIAAKEAARDGH